MIQYNNPIIKMLETLCNMMIVSLYWLICSLPIVTFVPASAALYHTCVKVIFGAGKGKGITKCYFTSFKSALHPGVILSLITIVATFFVIIGINTGLQLYKLNFLGTLYLVLGILICLVVYPAVVYIPIVVSRFEGNTIMVLRISLYFAGQNILVNIFLAVLLVLMYYAIGLFPLFILIVPALFCDLVRPQMEKKIQSFIRMNNLEEEESVEEYQEPCEEIEAVSDMEHSINQRRKSNEDDNGKNK